MDFSDLPVMQMMSRKMSWLSKRTDLLAENVANVDMPGYAARDLLRKRSANVSARAPTSISCPSPSASPSSPAR